MQIMSDNECVAEMIQLTGSPQAALTIVRAFVKKAESEKALKEAESALKEAEITYEYSIDGYRNFLGPYQGISDAEAEEMRAYRNRQAELDSHLTR